MAIQAEAPREDLVRGLTPVESRDDGNTMVGYPIVFDTWTEINSWEGRFLERVSDRFAKASLKARADRVRVQYNHGMHPVVGTSGLGKPKVLRQDEFGVWSEVPLSDTSYNRDIIKPQLRDGTLDGMSFRFSIIDDDWIYPKKESDRNPEMLPERTLLEGKIHEFGPVDWPAYEATMAGIRSQAAFALWQQTPAEERQRLMARFEIDPERSRVYAPGFVVRSEKQQDDQGVPDEASPEPGPAESTPENEGPAESTPEPETVTAEPPETDMNTPRSRDPKIRELELMRMRTVAANRAARLVRST